MSDDHVFNFEKAKELLGHKRQETVPVEKVFDLLQLEGHEKVADLGAGNGYLTLPIAKRTSDRVTAIDLQFEMLELLEARAVDEGLTNIDRLQSSLESLNLPDGSYQRSVAAFVLHEVSDLHQSLLEAYRILSADGSMCILDWERIEADQGPPLHQRISSNHMAEQVANAGFDVEVGHLNKEIYYIRATK